MLARIIAAHSAPVERGARCACARLGFRIKEDLDFRCPRKSPRPGRLAPPALSGRAVSGGTVHAACPVSGDPIGRYVFRGRDCFQASISALNQATEFGPNSIGPGNVPARISRHSWTLDLPASRDAPAQPRTNSPLTSTGVAVFDISPRCVSLRRPGQCSTFREVN
jgi:hypothetical protein